jgi:hypothetical protein
MAKRGGKTPETTVAATQHKLEDFAEDLGKMLGTARAKAEGWMGQRRDIVKNLTELRDTATKLLNDLGHEAGNAAADAGRRGRRIVDAVAKGMKRGPGRPAGGNTAIIFVGGKKKRTMSAEARRRISEAQKKRWALQKAGDKKK